MASTLWKDFCSLWRRRLMVHDEKKKRLREEKDATLFLLTVSTAILFSALLSFLLHINGPVPAKIAFFCLSVVAACAVFSLARKGLALGREEAIASAEIAVKTLTGRRDD